MFLEQQISILWRFSTAWYDSLGTVQNGTAQFAFPMQFSTALEWTGLFTCRYSCAASTAVTPEKLFHSASLHHALAGSAPRLSTRGTSVLPQQTTKQPFLVVKKGALIQNSCVRSFAGCADLNLAGLCVSCRKFNDAGSDYFLRPISDQQSLHVTFW